MSSSRVEIKNMKGLKCFDSVLWFLSDFLVNIGKLDYSANIILRIKLFKDTVSFSCGKSFEENYMKNTPICDELVLLLLPGDKPWSFKYFLSEYFKNVLIFWEYLWKIKKKIFMKYL